MAPVTDLDPGAPGIGKRTLTEHLPAAARSRRGGEDGRLPRTAPLSSPRTIHELFGRAGADALRTQNQQDAEDQRVFDRQALFANADAEIPALEGALLATRKRALQDGLISQASFDAALALSRAMAKLRPAIAANASVDVIDQQQAASQAQLLFTALQRETSDEHNYELVPAPRPSTTVTTENRYTRASRVTAMGSTQHFSGPLEQLPGLIRAAQWEDALHHYHALLEGLDRWIADRLRSKGPSEHAVGNAHEHFSQLRTGLDQIADKHASRLPAVFHPDAEIVAKEKAAGRPAADTIPVNLYVWQDAATGKYHLRDLTTPSRPHEQTLDGPPTAARLATFFEDVARYPAGNVRCSLPGGEVTSAATTGKTKWYEWAAYAGLALAGVGLALVTAGASIPATVCFAAGAIAGGISAGGHLVDSVRLGTATTATVIIDASQIATSFMSVGAMSIAVKAGGVSAALAHSRWFVPLGTAAAGADVVQLVALTDSTFVELRRIEAGPGSADDKRRAISVLVTQLVVATGLAALSVHGARNLRTLSSASLEIIDQNGAKLLRVAGEDAAAAAPAAEPPESAPVASVPKHAGLSPSELNQLSTRGVEITDDISGALAKVPGWQENARVGLARLLADRGTDAVRLSAKVVPNLDVDGMNTWVLLASRQLKEQSQLLELEQSLDKAIEIRRFDPGLAMEVDYYQGKRVTRAERDAARATPEFDKKKHVNFDIESSSERWEMKRVRPLITNKAKLLNQLKEGVDKYTSGGVPGRRGGGTKRNVVDVDFGDRAQLPGLDEASLRAMLSEYFENNKQASEYVDAFVVHIELEGTRREIVVEL